MSYYTDLVEIAIPRRPREIGEVVAVDATAGVCMVELPGGGVIRAVGAAALGDSVYVRDGVVEGVTAAGDPLITYEI